jgi:hypothetical protein
VSNATPARVVGVLFFTSQIQFDGLIQMPSDCTAGSVSVSRDRVAIENGSD